MARTLTVSIVTPAFNEELNLSLLHDALMRVEVRSGADFEWIIVDDHSSDETFKIAAKLAETNNRIRVFRLSRNSGSHNAILCGLNYASGDSAIIMASDLQDPPETLLEMMGPWREGAQVVWAVREKAPQDTWLGRLFARWYYKIMLRLGLESMAPIGADMVLLDRTVVDALLKFRECNITLFALISWMGFRQISITYKKLSRLHGRSGWTLRKKIRLAAESVIAFSFLPVRFLSGLGIVVAILGFIYALFVTVRAFFGTPVEGWSSLMVVVLIVGGVQLLTLGVIGEYVWRTLQEARWRPRFMVEAMAGGLKGSHADSPSARVVGGDARDASRMDA